LGYFDAVVVTTHAFVPIITIFSSFAWLYSWKLDYTTKQNLLNIKTGNQLSTKWKC